MSAHTHPSHTGSKAAGLRNIAINDAAVRVPVKVPPAPITPQQIAEFVGVVLADARVQVAVKANLAKGSGFLAHLSGTVESNTEKQSIIDRVMPYSTVGGASVSYLYDALTVRPPRFTDVWPLNALGVHGSADGGNGASAIDAVVDALNAVYSSADGANPVTRDRNNLWLTGSERTLHEIKGHLALIDTSFPQVQLDFWAVQISGDKNKLAARAQQLNERIQATADRMRQVYPTMLRVIRSDLDSYDADPLICDLRKVGFDRGADAPLSPVEALIFLALSQNRGDLLRQLQDQLAKQDATLAEQRTKKLNGILLPHLVETLDPQAAETDRKGVRQLIDAIRDYAAYMGQLKTRPDQGVDPDLRDAPARLAARSATIDRMLQALVSAFNTDLKELFLDPLLIYIRKELAKTAGGVHLGGKTRIVVTSRSQAYLKPELVSHVESTVPAPLTKEILSDAFPKVEAVGSKKITETKDKDGNVIRTEISPNTTTKTTRVKNPDGTFTETTEITERRSQLRRASLGEALTNLSGLQQLLAPMSPAQAALLAGALQADVAPVFTKIAPGIEIRVTPSVSPDSTSADLVLDARFGITTEGPNLEGRVDLYAQEPLDAVQSHHITTTASVTGSDLFDISSFTITTSARQAPFAIPFISRLPIIGRVFQVPRGRKTINQESVILVNPSSHALCTCSTSTSRDPAARLRAPKSPAMMSRPGTSVNDPGSSRWSCTLRADWNLLPTNRWRRRTKRLLHEGTQRRAAVQPQLLQQVVHVRLHRRFAHVQEPGDLPVGEPQRDRAAALQLHRRRQPPAGGGEGDAVGEARLQLFRDPGGAAVIQPEERVAQRLRGCARRDQGAGMRVQVREEEPDQARLRQEQPGSGGEPAAQPGDPGRRLFPALGGEDHDVGGDAVGARQGVGVAEGVAADVLELGFHQVGQRQGENRAGADDDDFAGQMHSSPPSRGLRRLHECRQE
jgi:hypothetical protein